MAQKQETDLVINENKAMEVATQESSFDLPALTNQEEAMEIMADNLAELEVILNSTRLKCHPVVALKLLMRKRPKLLGLVLDHYPSILGV